MTLSEKAIRQLDDLGFSSDKERKFYQSIWESEGEAFFWGFLEKEQESRDLYTQWAPQLREYAAQCRIDRPLPITQSLSGVDSAKYQILCDKISRARDKEAIKPRKEHNVVVLHSSPLGLLAANQILGSPSDSVIYLLDTESTLWFNDIYQTNAEAFWWYSLHWWSIKHVDELDDLDASFITDNYPKPDGFTYWIVTEGCQWGGLAGGADHELWKWDGVNAHLIEVFGVDTY